MTATDAALDCAYCLNPLDTEEVEGPPGVVACKLCGCRYTLGLFESMSVDDYQKIIHGDPGFHVERIPGDPPRVLIHDLRIRSLNNHERNLSGGDYFLGLRLAQHGIRAVVQIVDVENDGIDPWEPNPGEGVQITTDDAGARRIAQLLEEARSW